MSTYLQVTLGEGHTPLIWRLCFYRRCHNYTGPLNGDRQQNPDRKGGDDVDGVSKAGYRHGAFLGAELP